ncbi:hypothetical protein [Sulfolobus acidocaldarius]|uniref:hypothetical protein n=1 Tax=Sulfolobus acidocaldarius TaxID=2285 RepID=UPI001E64E4D5|nr:hypothetical protein [Sulfolobus acidocaldarius]
MSHNLTALNMSSSSSAMTTPITFLPILDRTGETRYGALDSSSRTLSFVMNFLSPNSFSKVFVMVSASMIIFTLNMY